MNHLIRIFSEKPDTKFKDKYTDMVFTVNELNEFLKEMIKFNSLEKDKEWFERFEKVGKK